MIRFKYFDSKIYRTSVITISNDFHAAYRNGPGMPIWDVFITVPVEESIETIDLDLDKIHYLDSDATLAGNHDVFHHRLHGDVCCYAQGRNVYTTTNSRQIDLIAGQTKIIKFTSYDSTYKYDVTEDWLVYEYGSVWKRARVYITMVRTRLSTGGQSTIRTSQWCATSESGKKATADVQSSIGFVQNYLSITPASDKAHSLREALDKSLAFGDLCFEACEDARVLDINSIAYLKDIAELNQLVQQLIQLYQSVTNPGKGIRQISKTLAKSASSAYLAEHYGLRLSVKDTQEILQGFSKLDLYRTNRYGAEKESDLELGFADDDAVHAVRKVTLDIDAVTSEQASLLMSVDAMKRTLLDLDILPTASNVWDMVPFSFVLDWFLPIGDYFEHRESMSYISTLPIRSAFYSSKSTWTESDTIALSNGTSFDYRVEHYVYERECRATLELPTFRPDSPQGLSNHWLEATALLITQVLK